MLAPKVEGDVALFKEFFRPGDELRKAVVCPFNGGPVQEKIIGLSLVVFLKFTEQHIFINSAQQSVGVEVFFMPKARGGQGEHLVGEIPPSRGNYSANISWRYSNILMVF